MLFAAQSMMFQAAAGLVAAPLAARSVERVAAPSMAVGLVYSTTTGNTETVAGYIAEETGLSAVDIADLTGEAVAAFDGIIVGAPTWHTVADTERSGTAWDEFIYGDLAGLDLKGKKVAIFGLGDQGEDGHLLALEVKAGEVAVDELVPRGARALGVGAGVPGGRADDDAIEGGDGLAGQVGDVDGREASLLRDVARNRLGVAGGGRVDQANSHGG